MSNQIFNFNSNPVRVELFDNQPYFCLLDVCGIFEIQNSRRVQSQMLDPQGVRLVYILAKDEKQRRTAFINEPNLYRIIFRSEKPIAKKFQNWVFEEVLPQIRKTGKYSLDQKQLALPEPEKTFTLNWKESELKRLASFWCATYEMHQMLKHFESGLRAIGSNFASTVYTQVSEYQSTLDLIHARLQVDIDPLQYTDPQNAHWQYCLNTINNYKPRAKLIPVRKYNF
ncbi:BRO family protein [Gallibacterium anatis]|uniref:BRO family protein n=1 Tax=Gallibacterium anatis TaxID=750 RepID=UPI0030053517